MVNNLLTLRAESEARVVTVNHKFQTKIDYTLARKIPSILNYLWMFRIFSNMIGPCYYHRHNMITQTHNSCYTTTLVIAVTTQTNQVWEYAKHSTSSCIMKYNFLLFYPYAYGPYVHMCKIHLVGNIDIKVSTYDLGPVRSWYGAWGHVVMYWVPATIHNCRY